MTTDLILIGAIALCTLSLTILRGLFNLPRPETKREQTAKTIFVWTASIIIVLNIWLGIRTYERQNSAPYRLDRQQLSMTIKLNCEHCSDSDIDSIKLPNQFTIDNIYLGSLALNCDFNRIETAVKISGPRAARRIIYYRSSYVSFENTTNEYQYLWDLNQEEVSLNLPKEFDELFTFDSTATYKIPWWSARLSVEIGKVSIGEGQLNLKKSFYDRPNFLFRLTSLSKNEVKAKWAK